VVDDIEDWRHAVSIAAVDGRPPEQWVPVVRAYRVAGLPVEDLTLALMRGVELDPDHVRGVVEGSSGYRLAVARGELSASLGGLLAQVRDAARADLRRMKDALRGR